MSNAALADELVNRITWKIPNALALVGSRAGEERNAMTTSWITQLSMEPVLIGVGVENAAVTHRLISDGGSFTVNLWDAENTRPFVKFSKPAAYERGRRRRPSNRITERLVGVRSRHRGASVRRCRGLVGLRGAPQRGLGHSHVVHRRTRGSRYQQRRGAARFDVGYSDEVRRREAPLSELRRRVPGTSSRRPKTCSATM